MMKIGRQGNTLLEVAIALAILSVVILGTIQGLTQIRSIFGNIVAARIEEQEVNNVIENLRNNIALYQVTFDSSTETLNEVLDPGRLPYAWNNAGIFPREACPVCQGHLGYVIRPYPMMRGVYLVTVRLTHPRLGAPVDRQFIVSTK